MRNRGEDYLPLVKVPGLFLEFAQLAEDPGLEVEMSGDGWLHGELETAKNIEVALDWVRRYGVLGCTPLEGYWTLDRVKGALEEEPAQVDPPGPGIVLSPPWGKPSEPRRWTLALMRQVLDAGPPGSPVLREVFERGGKKDTITRFVIEALAANRTLRLYEAATASTGEDEEAIEVLMEGDLKGITDTADLRDRALRRVARSAQEMVRDHCFPLLHRRKDGDFVSGWGFKSLLGAMWLQMYWLLTATGEVRRCRWCDKVIAFEQPEQPNADPGLKKGVRGAYRTRKDKKYCSDGCRGLYHYHSKVGPRR